ncbi:CLUMA_CG001958, isoform A [Clunio marinus]|uniref:CLUMA_CG001958, isoform A n=1 Tax=Clunio marinus TaxID=568069 RepID=A0A1J1HJH6_9DIPT|nr:CLUMA_CG001958, isoform A [Clunio marinus]
MFFPIIYHFEAHTSNGMFKSSDLNIVINLPKNPDVNVVVSELETNHTHDNEILTQNGREQTMRNTFSSSYQSMIL